MYTTFEIIDDGRFPHWPAVETQAQAVRTALAPLGVTFSISAPRLVDFTNTSEGNIQHRARVTVNYRRGQKQELVKAINAVIPAPVYTFKR